MSTIEFTPPELMSPAGYWPQLHAAVEAGADAVYFGLKHFSARGKVGFGIDELPTVMQSLHRRGVKGFVTFNTLVFDHEWELAKQAIQAIDSAKCDAIIVQDIGIAQLVQEIAPNLPIHGSTQMSITSAQGVELAASFGCSRVVLGRELDLADIRRIKSKTQVELETFVHGALCVSYSGQCFSSEAWGGRSANRGQCAQACRLSYDLIVDQKVHDLGASRYLLSPGDLYALEQIPELINIGIACVKIEGRYKDADYVSLTTAAYRTAIDDAVAQQVRHSNKIPKHNSNQDPTPKISKTDLEQIYSRGLGPYFMSGTNHQSVVTARAPRHRGVQVGSVLEVGSAHVMVKIDHDIHRGDGLVFDAADWRSPDEREEGGNVYDVTPAGQHVTLKFGHGEVDFGRIRRGDLVWRTNDPRLKKRIKPVSDDPAYTKPIQFRVVAEAGTPITVHAELESGETALFTGDSNLEPARSRGLDFEQLEKQLGRLGGTPFHLGTLKFDPHSPVFCPVSVLNQIRRDLVDQLLAKRESDRIGSYQTLASEKSTDDDSTTTLSTVSPTEPTDQTGINPTSSKSDDNSPVRLHVLVRTPSQLDAALEMRPSSITLDYLDLYGLRTSVEKIIASDIVARVASPRVLKPNEQNIIRFLLSLECQILVRSGGLLHDLLQTTQPDARPPLFGDFSLNAANNLSANTYLQMGVERIAPTHDLNAQQIAELAELVEPAHLEVIVYHNLPVFHMEHCVFCRFLSDGTDNTNCGHPCEKHQIAIRDSNGRSHPVLADVGCRNTVFGAEAQSAAKHLALFTSHGIRDFRLEFVQQTRTQTANIIRAFQRFIAEDCSLPEFQQTLDACTPQPTTEGSLFIPGNFKQLVQLS